MTISNYLSAAFSINGALKYQKCYKDSLYHQTQLFACLSNFVALRGGALKREQYLSGDMADFLGNLFFGYSLIWEKDNNGMDEELLNYSLKRLYGNNVEILNRVIDNLDLMILKPLKACREKDSYYERQAMIDYLYENENFDDLIAKISENCTDKEPFLNKLMELDKLERYSTNYQDLYSDIIRVGEYTIE